MVERRVLGSVGKLNLFSLGGMSGFGVTGGENNC